MPQSKKYQHRRSVETLELSGNGDDQTIARIERLIATTSPDLRHFQNLAYRILYLVEEARGEL